MNTKTKSKNKTKGASVDMSCPCGHRWYAGFTSGKVRKTVRCPNCLNFVYTSGKPVKPKAGDNCIGCKRPLLNDKHCTYCGRPTNEHPPKIGRLEPTAQFCTDDNLPAWAKKGKHE